MVEIQELAHIEKTDSKRESSCPKRTLYIGRRKVFCIVNLKTVTDKLIIVVYRFWNSLHLNDIGIGLNWSWQNTSHFEQNDFVFWVMLTYFTSGALYWMKQTSSGTDVFFLLSNFRMYPRKRLSFEHKNARKIFLRNASFFWHFRLSLRDMDQRIKYVEPFVVETRTWSS